MTFRAVLIFWGSLDSGTKSKMPQIPFACQNNFTPKMILIIARKLLLQKLAPGHQTEKVR